MEKNQKPPLPTLPMHLMLSMGTWLASPFALNAAKNVWPNWNNAQTPSELLEALGEEAKKRAREMLAGISRYLETPYTRDAKEPPVLWKTGNARLLDYGEKAPSIPILFVPSLINRYYILDLKKERSFLRYLASQGLRPIVLDWGAPGKKEADFDLEAYTSEILLPAIDYLYAHTGEKIALAGYCMGGVLAIAAAQLDRKKVSSLSLFATPWDFHCKQFAPFVVEPGWHRMIDSLLSNQPLMPADVVQSLFYMTDPWVFENKFRRFFGMNPASNAAQNFIALEHWVNDGIPMTARVARDCLLGWAQQNWLADGKWIMAGNTINPRKLNLPTFIAIPKNDHVVPFDCAWPLADMIKNATVLQPSAGHVGMIVGQHAKRELWEPFAEWLRRITP